MADRSHFYQKFAAPPPPVGDSYTPWRQSGGPPPNIFRPMGYILAACAITGFVASTTTGCPPSLLTQPSPAPATPVVRLQPLPQFWGAPPLPFVGVGANPAIFEQPVISPASYIPKSCPQFYATPPLPIAGADANPAIFEQPAIVPSKYLPRTYHQHLGIPPVPLVGIDANPAVFEQPVISPSSYLPKVYQQHYAAPPPVEVTAPPFI